VRDALARGGASAVGMFAIEMRTGMSQTNLRAALRQLADAGEVERVEHRQAGRLTAFGSRLISRATAAQIP
jgi:hypothetical protein